MTNVRIDHAVTTGTFSLDGQTFDVDNNVWVVGDDRECVVIDAPHDVQAIRQVVGDRAVLAVLCTHAHDDHVRFAPDLGRAVAAPVRPGAVCFYSSDLGVVFTGDTLFNGGPGATGRSFSDPDLIVASITDRLLGLPGDTVVKTGHGDDTTIEAESSNLS